MSEFFTNDLPRRFIHFLEAYFETDFNLSVYREILFHVFRLVRIRIQQVDNFCNADYNSFVLTFIPHDRDKAHRNALTYHRFLPRNDIEKMSIDKVHSGYCISYCISYRRETNAAETIVIIETMS